MVLGKLDSNMPKNETGPLSYTIQKLTQNKDLNVRFAWKDAQHHSLLEKCKSKPQWDTTSHWSEWPSSKKSLQAINAGEGEMYQKSNMETYSTIFLDFVYVR